MHTSAARYICGTLVLWDALSLSLFLFLSLPLSLSLSLALYVYPIVLASSIIRQKSTLYANLYCSRVNTTKHGARRTTIFRSTAGCRVGHIEDPPADDIRN